MLVGGLFSSFLCFPKDDELLKKQNVSDTILQSLTLIIAGPFDGWKALQQLFPGKHYKLVRKDYSNELGM
jgi:hypothetical protein